MIKNTIANDQKEETIKNNEANNTIKIIKYWGNANNRIFNNNYQTCKERTTKLIITIKRRKRLAKYHDVNMGGISTKYGERNFRIISAKVGDFRNYETIRGFDIRMNNADIVRIQETNNTKDNEMVLKIRTCTSQRRKKVRTMTNV